MQKVALTLSMLLAVALGPLTSTNAQADDGYPPITKVEKLYANEDFRGKPAPELVVKKWLTGKAPKTKGKVVLIDFWATWCPPCRELISELNDYHSKFGKDLVIIGISDETPAEVKTFMKTHPMKYNVAVDPGKETKSKIGITGIPHVLLISPDNIVRWQGTPGSPEDSLTEAKIAQVISASKSKE